MALLGDTLHNVADALTAVPLGIAFWLGHPGDECHGELSHHRRGRMATTAG
ncbi:hypothetical protein [Actinoplanes derwentensis]|uniref:hypothetical protein n=1 Tax=Actinoplanes derwentensis TaxID=113562 RepID=UPI001A428558|nr:hypothetical protein [Actinoplanes derwentensis]GID84457.1 hypothetical protein Ade03nite_33810 [Actinoplanes derwentensis]